MAFYPYNGNLTDTYIDVLSVGNMLERFVAFDDLSQITPSIFISGFTCASNQNNLDNNNIKYIINCTNTVSNYFENNSSLTYLRIPIDDTYNQHIEQYFDMTYNTIEQAIKENKNVLVHCHAGVSRSVTIVIAYLMRKNNLTYEQARTFVKSKRSIIDPNPDFVKSLQEFEKKI